MQLYTAAALAKALGLKTSEVEALRKAGVIGYHSGKLMCLEDSAARVIEYYKGQSKEKEALDYSTERAMLMRAKRIKEEHELDLQEGILHSAGDVEQIVTDMLMNFRARIMSVPAKLAPALAKETDGTEVYNQLKEAMDDALSELSDYDRLFGRPST